MTISRTVSREALAVSSTAVSPSTTVTTGMLYARCQVQGANVRVTWEGTTPTSTKGEVWRKGVVREVWGEEKMKNLAFIRDDSTDAVIEINYEGRG